MRVFIQLIIIMLYLVIFAINIYVIYSGKVQSTVGLIVANIVLFITLRNLQQACLNQDDH